MKLLLGNSNPPLAESVARRLHLQPVRRILTRFSDGEIRAEILESIRGEDLFIVQSTCAPANDNLMELLVCIDAVRRASADRITAVIPYFGYARQDRKPGPRTPISAKLVANLLVRAGVDRVLALDLHAEQIQGFFDVPVDNLSPVPVFADDIRAHVSHSDVAVVSPDSGGVVRARKLAQIINASFAVVDKRRPKPGVSRAMNVIGDVRNKLCILSDDIVDGGGTLVSAAQALLDNGAERVLAYASHGVLSKGAEQLIAKSPIEQLVLTDSVPQKHPDETPSIRRLSIAPLVAEAVRRTAQSLSVSSLFDAPFQLFDAP